MASMIRSGWRAGMAWSLASATMSSADAVWLAYSVWVWRHRSATPGSPSMIPATIAASGGFVSAGALAS